VKDSFAESSPRSCCLGVPIPVPVDLTEAPEVGRETCLSFGVLSLSFSCGGVEYREDLEEEDGRLAALALPTRSRSDR
jgi:hypothetical protein